MWIVFFVSSYTTKTNNGFTVRMIKLRVKDVHQFPKKNKTKQNENKKRLVHSDYKPYVKYKNV